MPNIDPKRDLARHNFHCSMPHPKENEKGTPNVSRVDDSVNTPFRFRAIRYGRMKSQCFHFLCWCSRSSDLMCTIFSFSMPCTRTHQPIRVPCTLLDKAHVNVHRINGIFVAACSVCARAELVLPFFVVRRGENRNRACILNARPHMVACARARPIHGTASFSLHQAISIG